MEDIQSIEPLFTYFICCHVYRERNMVANDISKDGMLLDPGLQLVKMFQDAKHFQYFHQPYMDGHDFAYIS